MDFYGGAIFLPAPTCRKHARGVDTLFAIS
jgi:hypothetical protein